MEFIFDSDKNRKLFVERGITFYKVIETIKEKGVLLDFEHPDLERHPGQRIFVIEIDKYTYCVPYKSHGDKCILTTAFPSRKFLYLLE